MTRSASVASLGSIGSAGSVGELDSPAGGEVGFYSEYAATPDMESAAGQRAAGNYIKLTVSHTMLCHADVPSV